MTSSPLSIVQLDDTDTTPDTAGGLSMPTTVGIAHVAPDVADSPPLTMTPADVARELRISLRSFRRHEVAGKIGPAPLHIGRAVRYLRDDVTRWIQAGMPDRDTWREVTSDIGSTLRRMVAAQTNGRRVTRRP
jgi:hypothetical protein